eukprot:jgi/Botrbrau1/19525/Bobra.0035s0024.2
MDTRLFGGPLAYLKAEYDASAKKARLAPDDHSSSDSSPEPIRRRMRVETSRRKSPLAARLLGVVSCTTPSPVKGEPECDMGRRTSALPSKRVLYLDDSNSQDTKSSVSSPLALSILIPGRPGSTAAVPPVAQGERPSSPIPMQTAFAKVADADAISSCPSSTSLKALETAAASPQSGGRRSRVALRSPTIPGADGETKVRPRKEMSQVFPENPMPPVLVPTQSGPLEIPHNPRFDLPRIQEVASATFAFNTGIVSPRALDEIHTAARHSPTLPPTANPSPLVSRHSQEGPTSALHEACRASSDTETTTSSVMTRDSSEEADQDGQSLSPISFPSFDNFGLLRRTHSAKSDQDAISFSESVLNESMAGQSSSQNMSSPEMPAWYPTDLEAVPASLSAGDANESSNQQGPSSTAHSNAPGIPRLALSIGHSPTVVSKKRRAEVAILDGSPSQGRSDAETEKHTDVAHAQTSLSVDRGTEAAQTFFSSRRSQDMVSPICLGKALDSWRELPPTPRLPGASSRKSADLSPFSFVTPWASRVSASSALEMMQDFEQYSLVERTREDDETNEIQSLYEALLDDMEGSSASSPPESPMGIISHAEERTVLTPNPLFSPRGSQRPKPTVLAPASDDGARVSPTFEGSVAEDAQLGWNESFQAFSLGSSPVAGLQFSSGCESSHSIFTWASMGSQEPTPLPGDGCHSNALGSRGGLALHKQGFDTDGEGTPRGPLSLEVSEMSLFESQAETLAAQDRPDVGMAMEGEMRIASLLQISSLSVAVNTTQAAAEDPLYTIEAPAKGVDDSIAGPPIGERPARSHMGEVMQSRGVAAIGTEVGSVYPAAMAGDPPAVEGSAVLDQDPASVGKHSSPHGLVSSSEEDCPVDGFPTADLDSPHPHLVDGVRKGPENAIEPHQPSQERSPGVSEGGAEIMPTGSDVLQDNESLSRIPKPLSVDEYRQRRAQRSRIPSIPGLRPMPPAVPSKRQSTEETLPSQATAQSPSEGSDSGPSGLLPDQVPAILTIIEDEDIRGKRARLAEGEISLRELWGLKQAGRLASTAPAGVIRPSLHALDTKLPAPRRQTPDTESSPGANTPSSGHGPCVPPLTHLGCRAEGATHRSPTRASYADGEQAAQPLCLQRMRRLSGGEAFKSPTRQTRATEVASLPIQDEAQLEAVQATRAEESITQPALLPVGGDMQAAPTMVHDLGQAATQPTPLQSLDTMQVAPLSEHSTVHPTHLRQDTVAQPSPPPGCQLAEPVPHGLDESSEKPLPLPLHALVQPAPKPDKAPLDDLGVAINDLTQTGDVVEHEAMLSSSTVLEGNDSRAAPPLRDQDEARRTLPGVQEPVESLLVAEHTGGQSLPEQDCSRMAASLLPGQSLIDSSPQLDQDVQQATKTVPVQDVTQPTSLPGDPVKQDPLLLGFKVMPSPPPAEHAGTEPSPLPDGTEPCSLPDVIEVATLPEEGVPPHEPPPIQQTGSLGAQDLKGPVRLQAYGAAEGTSLLGRDVTTPNLADGLDVPHVPNQDAPCLPPTTSVVDHVLRDPCPPLEQDVMGQIPLPGHAIIPAAPLPEQGMIEQNIAEQNMAVQDMVEQDMAEQGMVEQDMAEQDMVEQDMAEQHMVKQGMVDPASLWDLEVGQSDPFPKEDVVPTPAPDPETLPGSRLGKHDALQAAPVLDSGVMEGAFVADPSETQPQPLLPDESVMQTSHVKQPGVDEPFPLIQSASQPPHDEEDLQEPAPLPDLACAQPAAIPRPPADRAAANPTTWTGTLIPAPPPPTTTSRRSQSGEHPSNPPLGVACVGQPLTKDAPPQEPPPGGAIRGSLLPSVAVLPSVAKDRNPQTLKLLADSTTSGHLTLIPALPGPRPGLRKCLTDSDPEAALQEEGVAQALSDMSITEDPASSASVACDASGHERKDLGADFEGGVAALSQPLQTSSGDTGRGRSAVMPECGSSAAPQLGLRSPIRNAGKSLSVIVEHGSPWDDICESPSPCLLTAERAPKCVPHEPLDSRQSSEGPSPTAALEAQVQSLPWLQTVGTFIRTPADAIMGTPQSQRSSPAASPHGLLSQESPTLPSGWVSRYRRSGRPAEPEGRPAISPRFWRSLEDALATSILEEGFSGLPTLDEDPSAALTSGNHSASVGGTTSDSSKTGASDPPQTDMEAAIYVSGNTDLPGDGYADSKPPVQPSPSPSEEGHGILKDGQESSAKVEPAEVAPTTSGPDGTGRAASLSPAGQLGCTETVGLRKKNGSEGARGTASKLPSRGPKQAMIAAPASTASGHTVSGFPAAKAETAGREGEAARATPPSTAGRDRPSSPQCGLPQTDGSPGLHSLAHGVSVTGHGGPSTSRNPLGGAGGVPTESVWSPSRYAGFVNEQSLEMDSPALRLATSAVLQSLQADQLPSGVHLSLEESCGAAADCPSVRLDVPAAPAAAASDGPDTQRLPGRDSPRPDLSQFAVSLVCGDRTAQACTSESQSRANAHQGHQDVLSATPDARQTRRRTTLNKPAAALAVLPIILVSMLAICSSPSLLHLPVPYSSRSSAYLDAQVCAPLRERALTSWAAAETASHWAGSSARRAAEAAAAWAWRGPAGNWADGTWVSRSARTRAWHSGVAAASALISKSAKYRDSAVLAVYWTGQHARFAAEAAAEWTHGSLSQCCATGFAMVSWAGHQSRVAAEAAAQWALQQYSACRFAVVRAGEAAYSLYMHATDADSRFWMSTWQSVREIAGSQLQNVALRMPSQRGLVDALQLLWEQGAAVLCPARAVYAGPIPLLKRLNLKPLLEHPSLAKIWLEAQQKAGAFAAALPSAAWHRLPLSDLALQMAGNTHQGVLQISGIALNAVGHHAREALARHITGQAWDLRSGTFGAAAYPFIERQLARASRAIATLAGHAPTPGLAALSQISSSGQRGVAAHAAAQTPSLATVDSAEREEEQNVTGEETEEKAPFGLRLIMPQVSVTGVFPDAHSHPPLSRSGRIPLAPRPLEYAAQAKPAAERRKAAQADPNPDVVQPLESDRTMRYTTGGMVWKWAGVVLLGLLLLAAGPLVVLYAGDLRGASGRVHTPRGRQHSPEEGTGDNSSLLLGDTTDTPSRDTAAVAFSGHPRARNPVSAQREPRASNVGLRGAGPLHPTPGRRPNSGSPLPPTDNFTWLRPNVPVPRYVGDYNSPSGSSSASYRWLRNRTVVTMNDRQVGSMQRSSEVERLVSSSGHMYETPTGGSRSLHNGTSRSSRLQR